MESVIVAIIALLLIIFILFIFSCLKVSSEVENDNKSGKDRTSKTDE